MKALRNVLIAAGLGALLFATFATAQVSALFHPGGIQATDLCFHRMSDGGVFAEAWGFADGGTIHHATHGTSELSGTRQTNALAILDGPARNLCLNGGEFGFDGGPL